MNANVRARSNTSHDRLLSPLPPQQGRSTILLSDCTSQYALCIILATCTINEKPPAISLSFHFLWSLCVLNSATLAALHNTHSLEGCFSSFPYGTCVLSVSVAYMLEQNNKYLALDVSLPPVYY